MARPGGATATTVALAIALALAADRARAQATPPAPPDPAPTPQEPAPEGAEPPAPADGKPAPVAQPDAPQAPATPPGPAPPPPDARQRRPRFELLDPTQGAGLTQPFTALGYPVLMSPKALGYVASFPVVRLGRDGDWGTRIRLNPVTGLDNYEVGGPAVLVDVQTDLGGWSNILRFQFQDSEVRGSDAVRTDFRYDATLFTQGTVVDALFAISDLELRLLQRLGDLGPWEVWASIGGHYTRAFTRFHAPATGQRESNVMELPQLVAGGRLAWTPRPG
jgi:hypothetical protein